MVPFAGAERFTSFLWIQDSKLLFEKGMSNDHSVFLRPGQDLRPLFLPEVLRRGSASLLSLVKFFFLGGVSFSRFIVA